MKIAVYSRKSVLTGRGESAENQIELCKNYIETKMGGGEFEVYEDEGFSAKNTDRPEFRRLLKDIREGKIGALVCYRLDRISRNVGDFAALSEELIRRGVAFISVKEEFDTGTPMGKAMMYIASVFAQLERETIAERVKDNMHMLSKTGRWLGGTAPTGYKSEKYEVLENGKKRTFFRLCENKDESRKVKLIFSLFLNLKNVSAVRRKLSEREVKTRLNNGFSETAIKEILKNPVYAACDKDTYGYFKERGAEVTFSEDDFGKGIMPYGRRRGKTGAADITSFVIAAGEHPYLITGKEYTAAQEILSEKKAGKKRSRDGKTALLKGLLYCKCGREMRAKKRYNSDKFDYICSGKLDCGTNCCGISNLPGAFTDDAVFSALLRERSAEELYKGKNEKSEIKAINDEIKRKTRKIENLINALAEGEGYFAERVKDEINRLQKEREALLKEKERNINSLKENNLTTDSKRAYLKRFVEKVVWDGDELKTYFLP
ncbi:MAG: recombinase family protein [Clostridia bacterium]|nr:recombinase family protein [Clostridia bacterium]